MTAILRQLPFFDNPTPIIASGIRGQAKAHQIIVWVSITAAQTVKLERSQPRFPAILDTGSNFTFSIRASHLRQWAGIDVRSLDLLGSMHHRGRHVPVYAADLWLHRNRPGQRDVFPEGSAYPLRLNDGIAVYPNDFPDAPRLPLLGLRALEENRLHLHVDAERRRVALRSPDWRTWLGRWVA